MELMAGMNLSDYRVTNDQVLNVTKILGGASNDPQIPPSMPGIIPMAPQGQFIGMPPNRPFDNRNIITVYVRTP